MDRKDIFAVERSVDEQRRFSGLAAIVGPLALT
jgi:hypothetical protein